MDSITKAPLSSVLRRARSLDKQKRSLEDTISALLRGTFSEFDGLALAYLIRSGVTALAADLAPILATNQDALAKALAISVQEAVRKDFLLTGAEVIALLLKDAGANTAFGYAGTSELSLCDAFARLPEVTMVNARGDKECAFMAAGASLLTPLQGIGILHGARGLTNALGGIADARRNEVATVYVVGLPSTPSATFLPPHGEEGLIETIGRFTKWHHEVKAVPAESDSRHNAAREFVDAINAAVEKACMRPYGPTMLGIPQDVAEKAWVPWSVIAEVRQPSLIASAVDSVRLERVLDLLLTHEKPVVVDDSQMFGGLVSAEYDLLPMKTRVFGDHGGFVGGGLGFATGLAIADSDADVFCFLGDQGFTNAFQCLVAAVQENARAIIIVCNNGESVSLLTQAHASAPLAFDSGHHRYLKNAPGLEYWRVAQGIGVHSWLVDFTSDGDEAATDRLINAFRAALEAATVLRGPALVELRLPSRSDFWTGIWLTAGFEERKPATTLAPVA